MDYSKYNEKRVCLKASFTKEDDIEGAKFGLDIREKILVFAFLKQRPKFGGIFGNLYKVGFDLRGRSKYGGYFGTVHLTQWQKSETARPLDGFSAATGRLHFS